MREIGAEDGQAGTLLSDREIGSMTAFVHRLGEVDQTYICKFRCQQDHQVVINEAGHPAESEEVMR